MNNRHGFRAMWHDYGNGIYFITICTHEKRYLFGTINNGTMTLSGLGKVVDDCINQIPTHWPNAELLNYVVMPNHVHMVITVGARYIAPTLAVSPLSSDNCLGCLRPPKHGEPCDDFHHNSDVAMIVGTFKAAVTRISKTCSIAPHHNQRIWQRLFHEHIIRNRHSFENIMNYIDNNVLNWANDCFCNK